MAGGNDDMSVSSTKRDAQEQDPSLKAKELNPDITPTHPGHARATAQRAAGEPSDEELLHRYRNGDRTAFAELVRRYERELFHFLIRFLGDRVAAEDVFQETFLQVHQSAEQFDVDRRLRPWLFTIAANKARDVIRQRARRPTNPLEASISGSGDDDGGRFIDLMQASAAMPDEAIQKQEMRDRVQGIVMAMPHHFREILLLSYFHQFPYRQISDMLEIPLGTVKSRLHAAVANFAERWEAANSRHTSA
jgi:RNA polymerase sigma-70 factor, ECF subfamily